MTLRQSLLKTFYPVIMAANNFFSGNKPVLQNTANIKPPSSFYNLKATANDGVEVDFNQFAGKKILIVNTASDCGYTGQYEELEKLYSQYKNKLVIIGFPANDFKEQEKGSDETIAKFCKENYGVTFLLMKKSSVINGPQQNEVFNWLANKNKNGWNNKQPEWNFSKYLVNEEGVLVNYFASSVSPLSNEVKKAVEE
ncbi:MAG TPA: glutathione peroxidase [Panacibacter sp.]|nr:glutathione peroxidase [Panacibacter sp.]